MLEIQEAGGSSCILLPVCISDAFTARVKSLFNDVSSLEFVLNFTSF
jgi:hypothetical protein